MKILGRRKGGGEVNSYSILISHINSSLLLLGGFVHSVLLPAVLCDSML